MRAAQTPDYPDHLPTRPGKPRANKYGAKRTAYTNYAQVTRTYDSKKEAEYAASLDMLRRAGHISYWLPQVRIALPGGVSYVADFFIMHADGTVQWIDVKGRDTPLSASKRKIVRAIYGIDVEIV